MTPDQIASIVESAAKTLRLGWHPDRDDLEQDAAVAVLVAESRAMESSNQTAYLVSVARNRMLSELRRTQPEPVDPGGAQVGRMVAPERMAELGERWMEAVHEEVAGAALGDWPVVARVWGLTGDVVERRRRGLRRNAPVGESVVAVADDVGEPRAVVYSKLQNLKRRLRLSRKLRTLLDCADYAGRIE